MPKAACPKCGLIVRVGQQELGRKRKCADCATEFSAEVYRSLQSVSVSQLLEKNKYQVLLDAGRSSEQFVREALGILEADFRETALLALSDWARLEIVSMDMFQAVASLQRPSWGMWNGLITALKKSRTSVLRSATAEQREKVEQAELLKGLLELLDMSFDAQTAKTFKPLSDLTRASLPKKPKLSALLTLPINLRNRVAHDAPSAEKWWDEAAAALRPLIEFHTTMHPLHLLSDRDAEYPEPWFWIENDEAWAFNGLARDMAVIYVSAGGETKFVEERTQETLLEFQLLLGKTESQETDFRKLLSTLAPEEIKGVMLGDYLVGKPVGAGGFATVHVGRQLSTGRKVAIKILHDGQPEKNKERFQQEARFLSQLEHPNVVGVYGYGEDAWSAPRAFSLSDEEWFQEFSKGAPVKSFIAMEFVEGTTLDDVYHDKNQNGANSRQLAEWFSQAASALVAVHATGLVHRDIKPSNLMVDEHGEVKLMDFGIARSRDTERTLQTTAGQAMGTPAYMSPEQIRAADLEAEVGPASDVYSLCGTFYELFTRRRLFDHDTLGLEMVTTQKLSGERPQRPRVHARGLPWEMETIVMGGLEPDLGDRYASMDDLKRDVDHYLNDEPIEYKRPSLTRRLRLGYRRHRAVCNLLALFLLLAIGGAAFYIYQVTAARDLAKANEATAIENEKLATENEQRAKQSEAKAKEQLAIASIEQGVNNCENGRRAEGLAWLLKAYESVERDHALAVAARRLIGGWSGTLGPPLNLDEVVQSISADGRWVVTTSPKDQPDKVRRWDLTTGRQAAKPLVYDAGVSSAVLSGDGATLVTGCFDGTIWIHNAASGELLHEPLPAHATPVTDIEISHDGSQAITGTGEGVAQLWDVRAGEPVGPPIEHETTPIWVMISRDGRTAATTARQGEQDDVFQFWNAENGDPLGDPYYFADEFESGDVSVDTNGDVAVFAFGNKAKVLDARGEDVIERVFQIDGSPDSLALSGDGTMVVVGTSGSLQMWNVETGQRVGKPMRHTDIVRGIVLSADGRTLAAMSLYGVKLWNTESGQPNGVLPMYADSPEAIISDDGTTVVISATGVARAWDAQTSQPLGVPALKSVPPEIGFDPFEPLAISGDGAMAIAGGLNIDGHNHAVVWDTRTGQPVGRPLQLPEGLDAYVVAISDDGKTAATASFLDDERMGVWFWDVPTGEPLGQMLEFPTYSQMAIDAKGLTAVVCCDAGTATVVNPRTGERVAQWKRSGNGVLSLSRDGSKVITGATENEARIWDTRTGKPITPPLAHSEYVLAMALSRDGRTAVTGSGATVQVFNAETGQPVGEPLKHKARVWTAAVSNDGTTVLTVAENGVARYWETQTGKLVSQPFSFGTNIQSFEQLAFFRSFAALDADQATAITLYEDVVNVWHSAAPQSAADDARRLRLSVEVRTGLYWDAQGKLQNLSQEQWLERRQQLEKLGGPCDG